MACPRSHTMSIADLGLESGLLTQHLRHVAYHEQSEFSWTLHKETFMHVDYTIIKYNLLDINKLFTSVLIVVLPATLKTLQESIQNASTHTGKNSSGAD